MAMKIFLFASLTSVLFLASDILFAQDDDPIDLALNECLEQNVTTAGMIMCVSESVRAWEKEMKMVYGSLLSKLDSDAKDKLEQSQEAWLNFRDKEFEVIGVIYSIFDGTMYGPMEALDRMNVTKNRVKELRSYENLFEFE